MPEAFPEQSVQEGKRAGYIVYLPGIVVALIVAGVSYYQTGNYQQVKIWQQATAQAPALLDRALDPKADPLNEEEMSRLALGMRTQLQKNPGDIEGWIMLGRVGMALGNASIATDAYATAYRLDPKNSDAALGYAEALTRSSDPNDNRLGGELLRQFRLYFIAQIRIPGDNHILRRHLTFGSSHNGWRGVLDLRHGRKFIHAPAVEADGVRFANGEV